MGPSNRSNLITVSPALALATCLFSLTPAWATPCPFAATIYTPNAIRVAEPTTVCLDEGDVR
ncbi:MAG: hypothetical protein AAFN74_20780, partial [Myxococcota bacterium]